MRRIKVWEAEDGVIFHKYEDAFDYETLLATAKIQIGPELEKFILSHRSAVLRILSNETNGTPD